MGAASLEIFIVGFIRVYLLTSCFKCAALGKSREPRRTSAFLGKGKSRQSQTTATRIDPKKDLPDAVKKPIGKL